MKKLYSGIAATVLVATGLSCMAGAAHATATWPDGFTPTRVVATSDGALFVLGSDDSDSSEVVRVVGGDASVVDLGDAATPTGLAVDGDTAYVVGMVEGVDEPDVPTVWTVDSAGDSSAQDLPSTAAGSQSIAISEDGSAVGLVGWNSAVVYDLGTLDDTSSPTAIASTTSLSGVGPAAFNATDGTFEYAGTEGESAQLWSIDTDGGDAPPTSVTLGSVEGGSDPTGLAVSDDGTSYVTTTNGGDTLYAVRDGDVVAAQTVELGWGLTLSADGGTAYVNGDSRIGSYDVDTLGSYDDDLQAPAYGPSFGEDTSVVGLVTTVDRGALVAIELPEDGTPVVDRITAPSAPSAVKAERDETSVTLGFTAPSTTGSSAHPSDFATLVTYTVTLHDLTDPSEDDIVAPNWFETSDIYIGDETPLVAGHAYTVRVTATNGIFTSAAASYRLAAYQAPVRLKKVTGVKGATVKASSKKVSLTLVGVTTVPGKVKVYEGKKLLGTAAVTKGKVTLKLKKKLRKGKHTLTVKYAGSSTVAAFSKTVKIKVT